MLVHQSIINVLKGCGKMFSVLLLVFIVVYHVYCLEEIGILNPLDNDHLAALHYIYIPRINESLQVFVNGWNNHPMSSGKGQSPIQMYTQGMLSFTSNGIPALDYYNAVDEETYGHDDPDSEEVEVYNNASIINVPITDTNQSMLTLWEQQINPLQESDMHGVDLYLQALSFT